MWSKIDVEVCVNSASPEYVSRAVTAAQKGGAKRIELCAEMDLDGLTPAKDHIEAARYSFDPAGLLVMIRPRGGHFYYSLEEADVMVRQVRMAAAAGADGVVLGCLRARDSEIDESLLQRFMGVAREEGVTVTFHRAFDATPDWERSLDVLIRHDVNRVLTSGTRWASGQTALQGVESIDRIISLADCEIEVVIGGGVSPVNSQAILNKLSPSKAGSVSLHAYSGVLTEGEVELEMVRSISDSEMRIV